MKRKNDRIRRMLSITIVFCILSLISFISLNILKNEKVSPVRFSKRVRYFFKQYNNIYEAINNNDIRAVHWMSKRNPELVNGSVLYAAIKNNSLEITDFLISKGADVNYNIYNCTLLQYSILKGKREFAKSLILGGAEVNPPEKLGNSPLYLACRKQWLDVVKMLLAKGAKLNVGTKLDNCLNNAIIEGNKTLVECLIKAGADVNKKDPDMECYGLKTPLHYAAELGRLDIAKLLVKHNADVNARMANAYTPLDSAIDKGHKKLAKYLVEQGTDIYPETLTSTCWSPVLTAADKGDTETLKLLMEKGAIMDTRDGDGRTPLFYAVSSKNPEAVKLLIKAGVDINHRSNWEYSAVDYLVFKEEEEIFKLFVENGFELRFKDEDSMKEFMFKSIEVPSILRIALKKGLNYNINDETGRTPLFVAMGKGFKESVELMEKYGLETNPRDSYGNTPLHYAARNLNVDAIEYLCKKGVDVNAVDNSGYTPLCWAKYIADPEVDTKNRKKAIELLLSSGADEKFLNKVNQKDISLKNKLCYKESENNWKKDDVVDKFRDAIYKSDLKKIEGMVKKHPYLLTAKIYNSSVLHNMISERRFHEEDIQKMNNAIKLLISLGANIEKKDQYGFTPLHLSAAQWNKPYCNLLIESGAKINARDEEGQTPLHIACRVGNEETVRFLLKNGADINARDNFGETPLQEAVYKGNLELVKLLLKKGAKFDTIDNRGKTLPHSLVCREYRECRRRSKYHEYCCRIRKHTTVFTGYEDTARYLIKKGADVNARDNSGNTPLYYANKYGYRKTSKILKQRIINSKQ